MSGLLMRLAGPMQSWGERSTFDLRDTAGFPTRSGLLGLIAAALGRARASSLDDLAPLQFTIRIDRPGVRMVDYHTAGGGLPPGLKIPTADGKGRPSGKETVQTWREYLADAVFVVAVTGPDDIVGKVRQALRSPYWQPYLGRRSCPPSQPLLLDRAVEDPVTELERGVPLARRVTTSDDTVAVDFVRPTGNPDEVRSEIQDIPARTTPGQRAFHPRPVWIEPVPVSTKLGLRSLREYPTRMAAYVRGDAE